MDIVGQPLSLGTFNIFNCCPLSRGGETTSNKTVITDLNIMTLCTESVRAYSSPWVSIGAGKFTRPDIAQSISVYKEPHH